MTCKIERLTAEGAVVFRVSGHIRSKHMSMIDEFIASEGGQVELDLTEITLVEREAVCYLAGCELRSIKLKNCPSFLRDWIAEEQARRAANAPRQPGTDEA